MAKKKNKKRKKFLTKKKIFVLLVIILAGFLFFRVRNGNAVEVEAAQPARQDIRESVSASGEVRARKYSELLFSSTGELDDIFVEKGDIVKKGEKIARLDTTKTYQSYLQAEASLRSAQATLDRVYDEVKGHEDDESFEQRETRTAAEAAKDKAYRAFVIASENLADNILRAPFDGVVADVPNTITEGSYLTSTNKFTVLDPETMYFEVAVSEVEVPKLKVGQEVSVEIDAFENYPVRGQITYIGYTSVTTSTGGTAYPVEVELPQAIEKQLRVGMNGDAEFVIRQKDSVLTLPLTAIVEDDGGDFVWVVRNGKAKKTNVKTGISSINDIEIMEGLSGDETVIERPPAEIEEGTSVKIMN